MKRVLPDVLDWFAVWVIIFVSAALSTFIIDPTQFEQADKGVLLWRAGTLATAVTAFLAAITWVKRPKSSIPQDVIDRLPSDLPEGTT